MQIAQFQTNSLLPSCKEIYRPLLETSCSAFPSKQRPPAHVRLHYVTYCIQCNDTVLRLILRGVIFCNNSRWITLIANYIRDKTRPLSKVWRHTLWRHSQRGIFVFPHPLLWGNALSRSGNSKRLVVPGWIDRRFSVSVSLGPASQRKLHKILEPFCMDKLRIIKQFTEKVQSHALESWKDLPS